MTDHSVWLKSFDCSHKKDVFMPYKHRNSTNSNRVVAVKCLDVYDGDTCKLAFHLFDIPSHEIVVFSCRLDGIDTPEMKGTHGNEKELAIKARDFIREKCLDKCIYAHFRSDVHEKYGRLMVWLYAERPEGEITFEKSLNNELVKLGYAKLYNGGKKEEFDY